MPPTVRLRSRRQTTGPQSSTRLLKRPGERPRVAKPQPSEQGLPPRRKPGAKLRSRRSARQQGRRGSKPSSERSVKLPRRRNATLREKPSARRRGRQSAKPLRKRRLRLPNARRRRRRSVKPPARSSAKRPRRQSEKLPGSRRWRLPHRQNAKLRRRSRPSARLKIREVGEPAKSEVAAKTRVRRGASVAACAAVAWGAHTAALIGQLQPSAEHFPGRGSDKRRPVGHDYASVCDL